MSSNYISSDEFTTLCRSQLTLLAQGLGAVWSVVYLTEEISENGQTQLFPFAIYPQERTPNLHDLRAVEIPEVWQALPSPSFAKLLPDNLVARGKAKFGYETDLTPGRQLIVPLMYRETFIGLLVARRDDREWRQQELEQIEEVARTIAIARYVEFQYLWTQDRLTLQENLRRIEHDRLDNLFHQLRNPLTALRTFSKLLLKRMLPNDGSRKIAQSILAQGDRFQALLEQFEAESARLPGVDNVNVTDNTQSVLATDARIDRSSFLLPSSPQQLKPIELKEVLTPLLQTAKAISREKDIEIIESIPQATPLVKGDLAALNEILSNLLDNAIKYTPSGGKIQLELRSSRGSTVGIAVKDTGVGIPEGDRERIFERHYRGVQAEGNIPGTGLGLAIASELAVKMGGRIELISPNNFAEAGKGTTFVVWLPLAGDR